MPIPAHANPLTGFTDYRFLFGELNWGRSHVYQFAPERYLWSPMALVNSDLVTQTPTKHSPFYNCQLLDGQIMQVRDNTALN